MSGVAPSEFLPGWQVKRVSTGTLTGPGFVGTLIALPYGFPTRDYAVIARYGGTVSCQALALGSLGTRHVRVMLNPTASRAGSLFIAAWYLGTQKAYSVQNVKLAPAPDCGIGVSLGSGLFGVSVSISRQTPNLSTTPQFYANGPSPRVLVGFVKSNHANGGNGSLQHRWSLPGSTIAIKNGNTLGGIRGSCYGIQGPAITAGSFPGYRLQARKILRLDQPFFLALGTMRVVKAGLRVINFAAPQPFILSPVNTMIFADFAPRAGGNGSAMLRNCDLGTYQGGPIRILVENDSSIAVGSAIIGSVGVLVVPIF